MSQETPVPPLCGIIAPDSTEGKILEATLAEPISYADNDSPVVCFRELLGHLKGAFGFSAVFAFFRDSERKIHPMCSLAPGAAIACETVVLQLAHSRYLSDNLEHYHYQELSKKDTAAMGIKECFPHGFVVQVRTLPICTTPDSYVVAFFFDNGLAISDVFMKQWIKTLFTIWPNAFHSALQQFRHSVQKLQGDELTLKEMFRQAARVHPWLPSSELCRICEAAIRSLDRRDHRLLETQIIEFCKRWHYCLDRGWPCDEGNGFPADERGPLNWYLWRLASREDHPGYEGEYLSRAIKFTGERLARRMERFQSGDALNACLDKYFLHHVLLHSNKLLASLNSQGPENYEKQKQFFGQYGAECISDAPLSSESIESQIWMVSEYAYAVLNVDRRLHIGSHLRHSARGEPSLHMMKAFYRDHFFHTIDVCLLGHLLAHAKPAKSGERGFITCTTAFLRKWYTASLLHDVGYAVDICEGLSDWLKFFASDAFHALGKRMGAVLEPPHDGGDETDTDFASFCSRLGAVPSLDEPAKDHGIVGAYHLHTLVEDIKKTSKISVVDSSIRAIAQHNCHRLRINFEAEPLSALLVLCDTLQTWRRPQFTYYSSGPSWMMAALSSHKHSDNSPQAMNAILLTNLEFKSHKGGAIVPQFRGPLVLRLVYDESVNRDSFVFNVWLDALCDFQRVDFRRLPHNIVVQIQTPTYVPTKETSRHKQMDRLRDAAADTHMAYLSDFLSLTANEVRGVHQVDQITNGHDSVGKAVAYYVDYDHHGDPTHELLSFSLKHMDGNRQYMRDSLSRFRKDLKNWKKYTEDRPVQGDYSPWQHRMT